MKHSDDDSPFMSRGARWLAVALVVVCIVGAGLFAVGFSQYQEEHQRFDRERAARLADECGYEQRVHDAFAKIIGLVTTPASTAGLSPERAVVVEQVNQQRAAFAAQVAPIVAGLACPPG